MLLHLVALSILLTAGFITTPGVGAENQPIMATESKNYAVTVSRDDASATSLTVELSEYKLDQIEFDGENYSIADFGPLPITCDPGWPLLPIITQVVLVPPDKGVHLQVNHIESRIEQCDQPWITPEMDGSVDIASLGEPAPEYLQHDGFWPPDPVVMSEPAIMRGYRMVHLTFYPMQYNPSTGQMRFNDIADFNLVYEGTGINTVTNPSRPRPSSSIQTMLEALVVNPPPRRDHPAHAKRGSYLLIWPDVNGVEDAIQPLLEWRARQGWEVHAVQVNNNAGTNAVKRIIQDAYDDWDNPPEMVVLVGDADGSIVINAYNQTDFDYVLLDGNDILGDADLGRLSVESVNRLRQVVAKLVNYEADPWMEDTEWYTRGMVCAGYAGSGLSTVLVNRWLKRELMLEGFEEEDVHEWYFNAPYRNQSVPSFFQSEFQEGIAVSNYRGWVGIEGTSPNAVLNYRAHRRYPVATIMTCSSGNYIGGAVGMSEAMLRSPGGGIGGIGFCTNGTHVQHNNAVDTGIWHGFLREHLYHFGSAVTRGKVEIYRQYWGHENGSVSNFARWANLMGDPATHIFTGVPRTITVDHTPRLATNGSHVFVYVEDEENETLVKDAFVCLYKADDEFQVTKFTDREGSANFILPSEDISEGELMLTVTKHNTVPYLAEIEINQREYFLGVSDWEIEDDEDGEPNPGETIDMTIRITNFGTEVPEGELVVSATSLSDWAEVTSDPFETDDVPAVDETIEVPVTVQLHPSVPDGEEILIEINTVNEDNNWLSMASLEALSPRIAIEEFNFAGDGLDPGEIVELDITIENIGRKVLEPFTAHLWSETSVASVIDDELEYNEIEPGRTAGTEDGRFRARAHPLTVPGMNVVFALAVETENGFCDTTRITYQVGQTSETDPFGPDEYGYVCFDSGDEGWELHPIYDWIEIDPDEDADFDGEDLRLRDSGEDQDESEVIEIPFEFQYYGELFDQITICTNGWVAFGNWSRLSDFRNRRIASGGGPNAQLCVFWDNLNTGKILTYYDEDSGRFIVEWNNMRRQWGGQSETFELILYEQWVEPTYSGDGIIVYQYKDIQNTSGNDQAGNDTPYATVGIGNLDDTDGLEYTYWNEYPRGAKELESEMALKFTTATDLITGILEGTVTDAATGDSIAGAEIIASRGARLAGFWTETDENGHYSNDEILIGENYTITATAQGYNDSTLTGFEIRENDTTTVNFSLLHPEFNYNPDSFSFTMLADSITETTINLSNDGNGTLGFGSRYVYVIEEEEQGVSPESRSGRPVRDDPDEAWDNLLMWSAGDSVEDSRLNGVAYVGDRWYVSGGANGEEENWFYIFDRWGSYVDRIAQPIEARYGYRDMDYYDGYLYCASGGRYISKINPETGEEVARFPTPMRLTSARNIAVVNDTLMYSSAISNDLYLLQPDFDSTLIEVRRYPLRDPRVEDQRLHVYGLTWFRDDPDNYNLYIITNEEPERDPEKPDISIFKMNPTDGDVRFLTDLSYLEPSMKGRGGICITPKWNNLVWAFAAVLDDAGGDKVGIFELAPNSSWIDYNPRTDTLFAGEATEITLDINTADLDTGRYGVVIQFNHNAGEGISPVPVNLHVVLELPPPPGIFDDDPLPFEYSLSQNRPNPFNSTARIDYSLREPGQTTLVVYDLLGRNVSVLVEEHQPAGRYHLTLDAGKLPAGLYFYKLESGSYNAVKKLVIIK